MSEIVATLVMYEFMDFFVIIRWSLVMIFMERVMSILFIFILPYLVMSRMRMLVIVTMMEIVVTMFMCKFMDTLVIIGWRWVIILMKMVLVIGWDFMLVYSMTARMWLLVLIKMLSMSPMISIERYMMIGRGVMFLPLITVIMWLLLPLQTIEILVTTIIYHFWKYWWL